MHVQQMVATHPEVTEEMSEALLACVEQCFDCAQTCLSCADACLAEDDVDGLRQCIRLDLDCADVCHTVGKLASRRTGSNTILLRQALQTCLMACEICERECQRHALHHEHCKICAEACGACRDACAAAIRRMDDQSASMVA